MQVTEDCGRVIFFMTEREKETGYKLLKGTKDGDLETSVGKVTWTLADRPEGQEIK